MFSEASEEEIHGEFVVWKLQFLSNLKNKFHGELHYICARSLIYFTVKKEIIHAEKNKTSRWIVLTVLPPDLSNTWPMPIEWVIAAPKLTVKKKIIHGEKNKNSLSEKKLVDFYLKVIHGEKKKIHKVRKEMLALKIHREI